MINYKFITFLIITIGGWFAVTPAAAKTTALSLKVLDSEPESKGALPSDEDIAKLKKQITSEPKERRHRFALVRAYMKQGDLEAALDAAAAWRAQDAYNLVVVRLIGDILTELGRPEEARRTYSAVVELLPKDASAHRALATVLKQSGDLKNAYARLAAAAALRPEDRRLGFELADAAERNRRIDEAETRFRAIVDDDKSPHGVQYPAKQRLAQILSAKRVEKLKTGETTEAQKLKKAIDALAVKGGAVNDIKVYLTWDTDGSDVDLWITNPAGQKVFYQHKTGTFGGTLYHDVTSGYGPESFTATRAHPGKYLVQVNYFGTSRRTFAEARGEVTVVLKEGTTEARTFTLPYRLFKPKQTVAVAEITVE